MDCSYAFVIAHNTRCEMVASSYICQHVYTVILYVPCTVVAVLLHSACTHVPHIKRVHNSYMLVLQYILQDGAWRHGTYAVGTRQMLYKYMII